MVLEDSHWSIGPVGVTRSLLKLMRVFMFCRRIISLEKVMHKQYYFLSQ